MRRYKSGWANRKAVCTAELNEKKRMRGYYCSVVPLKSFFFFLSFFPSQCSGSFPGCGDIPEPRDITNCRQIISESSERLRPRCGCISPTPYQTFSEKFIYVTERKTYPMSSAACSGGIRYAIPVWLDLFSR